MEEKEIARLIVRPNRPDEETVSIPGDTFTLGSSQDNDLVISEPSVSHFHAKIVRREKRFSILDLGSERGTFVNRQRLEEAVLENGDLIELGKVSLVFRVEAEVEEKLPRPGEEETRDLRGRELSLRSGGRDAGLVAAGLTCARCGMQVGREVSFCPRCGSAITREIYPPAAYVPPVETGLGPRGPGILPLLSLILGICGPLALGVGWLAAILIGFGALQIIRRTGGFRSDRKRCLWGIGLGFCWLGLMGAIAFATLYTGQREDRIARNENGARTTIKHIAITEEYIKSIHLLDKDADGVSEFGELADLVTAQYRYFDKSLTSGKKQGYRFSIHDPSEETFTCSAVPLRYGGTGVKTFYIDEKGFLWEGDTGSASLPVKQGKLENVSEGKPVIEQFQNEIAQDLLGAAKRAAEDQDYEKSDLIIETIREKYPVTEVVHELEAVERVVEPFIIDQRTRVFFERAMEAWKRGDGEQAVSILEELEDKYPTSSLITQVRDKLSEIRTTLSSKFEQEAQVLLEEGQKLQLAGEYAKAIEIYSRMEREFSESSYYKQVEPVVEDLKQKAEEEAAKKYLAELVELPLETEYEKVLRLTDLLWTAYPETIVVRTNSNTLATLARKAAAAKYKKTGLVRMEEGNYREAGMNLREAMKKNPDLAEEAKELLRTCYQEEIKVAADQGDHRRVVDTYEDLEKLFPGDAGIDENLLMAACYELAKIDFVNGYFDSAEESLAKVASLYSDDVAFHYLLGRILSRNLKYEAAIRYFGVCLEKGEKDPDVYRERAVAELGLALASEWLLNRVRDFLATQEEAGKGVVPTAVQLATDIQEALAEMKEEMTGVGFSDPSAQLEKTQKQMEFVRQKRALGKSVKAHKKITQGIVARLKEVEKNLRAAVRDMELAMQAGAADSELKRMRRAAVRKFEYLSKARPMVEDAVRRQIDVEENLYVAISRALEDYQNMITGGSIGRKVESILRQVPDLDRLMQGDELIARAARIRMPIEFRKQFPIRASITCEPRILSVGDMLTVRFELKNISDTLKLLDISEKGSWKGKLIIVDEDGIRVKLGRLEGEAEEEEDSGASEETLLPNESYVSYHEAGIVEKAGRYHLHWEYLCLSTEATGEEWETPIRSNTVSIRVNESPERRERREKEPAAETSAREEKGDDNESASED